MIYRRLTRERRGRKCLVVTCVIAVIFILCIRALKRYRRTGQFSVFPLSSQAHSAHVLSKHDDPWVSPIEPILSFECQSTFSASYFKSHTPPMTYVTTGMVPSLAEDDNSEDDTLQLSFCHGWRGYLLTPVFDPKHPIPDRPQFTAYRALLDSERVTCSLTAESFPCLNGHWVRQALHVDHIHYLRILPPSVPQRVLLGLVSAGVTLDLISVHKEAVDRNFVQWMDRVIGYIQIYMDGQMVFWAPDPSRLPHRPIGSTASQSSS